MLDHFANSTQGVTDKKGGVDTKPKASVPNYAYSCENYLDPLLENALVRQTLRTVVKKCYGKQLDDIVRNDTEATATNYPVLWANYQHCCTALGLLNRQRMFVTSRLKGINALSVEVADETVILLSFPSAILLSDAEQRFLLGHELGHIQLGHLLVHSVQGLLSDLNKHAELLGPIVNDFLDVPLNRWFRTSEFTADRAGFLCCRDFDSIRKLFARLDEDALITTFDTYRELSEAYPRKTVRMEVLQEFINNKG